MKHIITLSLLFILTTTTWSQDTWVKTIGGRYRDFGESVTATSDGGIVLMGRSESDDGDFKGVYKGGQDIFVIKLDTNGKVLWKKVFGGSERDEGFSITTTGDGGILITGTTHSNDGDFEGMEKGSSDIFVIRLDRDGKVLWKKTYGGSEYDHGSSITTTSDGGIVLTGQTYSNDGDFKGMNKGGGDIFVMKLDSNGNLKPSGKKKSKKK